MGLGGLFANRPLDQFDQNFVEFDFELGRDQPKGGAGDRHVLGQGRSGDQRAVRVTDEKVGCDRVLIEVGDGDHPRPRVARGIGNRDVDAEKAAAAVDLDPLDATSDTALRHQVSPGEPPVGDWACPEMLAPVLNQRYAVIVPRRRVLFHSIRCAQHLASLADLGGREVAFGLPGEGPKPKALRL